MWISRKLYCQMVAENARLDAQLGAQEVRVNDLRAQLERAEVARNELLEDVRKLVGLKRIQVPAAQPEAVGGGLLGDIRDHVGPQNKQFKMKETPRDMLIRLQTQHNKQADEEDQLEIRAAIAAHEGVLK